MNLLQRLGRPVYVNRLLGTMTALAVLLVVLYFQQRNDYESDLAKVEAELDRLEDTLTYYQMVERTLQAVLSGDSTVGRNQLDKFAQSYPEASALSTQARGIWKRELELQERGDSLNQEASRRLAELSQASYQIKSGQVVMDSMNSRLAALQQAYQKQVDQLAAKEAELRKAMALIRDKPDFGRVRIPDGRGGKIQYFGETRSGIAEGFGVGLYESGGVYHGQWLDDQRHGHGTYRWTNGDRYEGKYLDNMRHGWGTYFFHTGEKYTGEWEDDKRHGEGTFFNADGKVVLQGQWVEDQYQEGSGN